MAGEVKLNRDHRFRGRMSDEVKPVKKGQNDLSRTVSTF
jgi:hypothetical protein